MTDPVLFEKGDGGIATITLNRPDTRNAISDADVIEALLDTLAAADRDIEVRALVLTGAGSAFSSGGNIKTMGKGGGLAEEVPAQTRRNYRYGIQRLPLAFEALEVPVVAAVNGPAIGAGCDLTLMCDLRIASENARFAESFVKIGIVPGDGGAWLLPRVVGFSKACEMALTGDPVDAQEALACGLVSRVVPAEELMEAAHARSPGGSPSTHPTRCG
ncbi:enoyl-CoA hydratase-related protein [Acuticoccus sp.]|uniref:enoyl-CoA hydratase-related protein n=1 Tax=Acuticoccus sp. TaxID=1904378 RepID=UPI003B52EC38